MGCDLDLGIKIVSDKRGILGPIGMEVRGAFARPASYGIWGRVEMGERRALRGSISTSRTNMPAHAVLTEDVTSASCGILGPVEMGERRLWSPTTRFFLGGNPNFIGVTGPDRYSEKGRGRGPRSGLDFGARSGASGVLRSEVERELEESEEAEVDAVEGNCLFAETDQMDSLLVVVAIGCCSNFAETASRFDDRRTVGVGDWLFPGF